MRVKNLLVIEKSKFKTETIKRVFTNFGYKNIKIVEEEEEGIHMMEEKVYHRVLVAAHLIKDEQKFYEQISELNKGLTQKVLLI